MLFGRKKAIIYHSIFQIKSHKSKYEIVSFETSVNSAKNYVLHEREQELQILFFNLTQTL